MERGGHLKQFTSWLSLSFWRVLWGLGSDTSQKGLMFDKKHCLSAGYVPVYGGFVCEARRLLYHSTLVSRVIKQKRIRRTSCSVRLWWELTERTDLNGGWSRSRGTRFTVSPRCPPQHPNGYMGTSLARNSSPPLEPP